MLIICWLRVMLKFKKKAKRSSVKNKKKNSSIYCCSCCCCCFTSVCMSLYIWIRLRQLLIWTSSTIYHNVLQNQEHIEARILFDHLFLSPHLSSAINWGWRSDENVIQFLLWSVISKVYRCRKTTFLLMIGDDHSWKQLQMYLSFLRI